MKLSEKVPHENKQCPIHGCVPHSQYVGGNGMTPRWVCNKCEVDRAREYEVRKKSGGYVGPRSDAKKGTPSHVCPACWLDHPSGVCDR